MRKPIPALVGSLVRSSFVCGLELEQDNSLTPRVCCPAGGLSASPVISPDIDVEQQDEMTDLNQHPGLTQLADQDACGISLVHDRPEDVSGLAGLGQYPWLAILGNTSEQFSNINNNCLAVLIGPQVLILTSSLSLTLTPP